jgi:Zn-dependent peptidase ImmA (M78 family)/transcriptional regulator with XRE-family HTH domain
MRVEVKPELLRWACERAGLDIAAFSARFPQLDKWESGEIQPTLKQLEAFAKATHAPVGYFFLAEPPVEQVPIPDFRTVGSLKVGRPSADLLDTIYLCQQRQEWYREYSRWAGADPLAFVGSVTMEKDVEVVATTMRRALKFDLAERKQMSSWSEALRRFIEQADELGVLAMVNGVVGSNNKRKLDPDEFRGFALADTLAPLVFINGADTKSAQMFTLAHELAHLWLGQSAVSDVAPTTNPSSGAEAWCNRVAAEFLVPLDDFRKAYRRDAHRNEEMARLAREFKVSTLVILRRMFDAGGLTRAQLDKAYAGELKMLRELAPKSGGGDFYLTLGARVGKRFARALVTDTLEGQTLYRDAFRLLGFSKVATFEALGHRLGVV